jgi:ABC-type transporter Mla subunit MlaD
LPNALLNLDIDRVDLVDEGANSAAFIKLYKRKERVKGMDLKDVLAKIKPEHAEVIESALEKAKNEVPEDVEKKVKDLKAKLEKANKELKEATERLEKSKELKKDDNLEEIVKSLDGPIKEAFEKLQAQKKAAEEIAKQLQEQKEKEAALAKAKELKNLPMETEKLAGIIKNVSPEVFELLKAANEAIEKNVLGTVGDNGDNTINNSAGDDAWAKIEKKAKKLAKEESISMEKAIAKIIDEEPELYEEYLEGGRE